MSDINGEQQGLMTMIYDSDRRELRSTLINIQHEFKEIIRASFHSHTTGNQSLEVILLRGYGTQFISLEHRLISEKGVVSVDLKMLESC